MLWFPISLYLNLKLLSKLKRNDEYVAKSIQSYDIILDLRQYLTESNIALKVNKYLDTFFSCFKNV